MRIVNTRPAERAEQLSRDLRGLGYQVYALPLLALHPLPLDAKLEQQFIAFLSAHIVVAVSPIAVELGMRYYQTLGYDVKQLQNKQWIAVGKTTQNALLSYGIDSLCPVIETSEGMLQLSVFKQCQQQTIAFWRGIGGRTLMMEQLRQQGCHTINMLLYHRQIPEYTCQSLTQLFTFLPATILISSEESWNNWLSLCQGRLSGRIEMANNIYVVLGERVTAVVRSYFIQHNMAGVVLTVTHLDAGLIHQQLQQCLNHE